MVRLVLLAALAFLGWALGRFLDSAVTYGKVDDVLPGLNFAILGVLLFLAFGGALLFGGTTPWADKMRRVGVLAIYVTGALGLILALITVFSTLPYKADRIMSGVAVVFGWIVFARLLVEASRAKKLDGTPDRDWTSLPAIGGFMVAFTLLSAQTVMDVETDQEIWSGFPGFAAYCTMLGMGLWLVVGKKDPAILRQKAEAIGADAARAAARATDIARAFQAGFTGGAVPAAGAAAAGAAGAAAGAAGGAGAAGAAGGAGAGSGSPAGAPAGSGSPAGSPAGAPAGSGSPAAAAAPVAAGSPAPAPPATPARPVAGVDWSEVSERLNTARKNLNWAYKEHIRTELDPQVLYQYRVDDADIKERIIALRVTRIDTTEKGRIRRAIERALVAQLNRLDPELNDREMTSNTLPDKIAIWSKAIHEAAVRRSEEARARTGTSPPRHTEFGMSTASVPGSS